MTVKGIQAIVRKELADHFSSYRFTIIFALITMVSLITAYMVGLNIKSELEGVAKPKFVFLMLFTSPGAMFSLVQFVAFFGPLVGLILGFDSINRERNEGTLSKLLSQPIYRDVVINGKFLAAVFIISVMMLAILMVITGLGLLVVGVVPGPEEIARILIYLVISIIYISFWLAISILFSILFRSTATSALASLAVWIFFSFFVGLGASVLANTLVSDADSADSASLARKARVVRAVVMTSPLQLYTDATATIIDPTRKSARTQLPGGPLESISMTRFAGPLPLIQSVLVVVPYILSLVAITIVCFAVSYTVFMKQEIRSF
jgi:ABC-2 type transport system permease protein